jgi:hypothetical protein
MEEAEILRIIDDNIANGSHVVEQGVVMPVVQESSQTVLVEAIDGLINISLR